VKSRAGGMELDIEAATLIFLGTAARKEELETSAIAKVRMALRLVPIWRNCIPPFWIERLPDVTPWFGSAR
jgi:hypothetical protein